MSNDIFFFVVIQVGILLTMLVLFVGLVAMAYRKVGPDKALIRGGMQAIPGSDGETRECIREVAEVYGCQRATNLEALHELFDFKFTDALRQTASQFDANDLVAYTEYERYSSHVLDSIGGDLNGYQLDEINITFPGLR